MKKKSILFSFPPKRRLKFTPKNIFFFFRCFCFHRQKFNELLLDRSYLSETEESERI
jgi:hypothetical protein